MKTIFIWVLLSAQALSEEVIQVKHSDGTLSTYSSKEYKIVKKEKNDPNTPIDYSKKKFLLKANSVSLYMGRGPTHLTKIENRETGSVTYQLNQDNIYGLGLSQRLGESFHLEMIGLSNETIMSGFKFEFGSP